MRGLDPRIHLFATLPDCRITPFAAARRTTSRASSATSSSPDELPRTGLPELFHTNDDYDEFVAALTWAKIIPDASYIWWAMRPSLNTRPSSCASQTAARGSMMQSPSPTDPLPGARARPRPRAQRRLRPRRPRHHRGEQVARAALRHRRHLRRSVRPLAANARAMARPSCSTSWSRISRRSAAPPIYTPPAFIRRLHCIIAEGTSADRQIELYSRARAAGRQRLTAIKEGIDWAARETQAV